MLPQYRPNLLCATFWLASASSQRKGKKQQQQQNMTNKTREEKKKGKNSPKPFLLAWKNGTVISENTFLACFIVLNLLTL